MSRQPTKPTQWMPLHIDAWRTKTRRLSPVERCAYMDLLLEYWDTQAPLVVDHDDFANLIGISRAEWDKISDRVLRFFEVDADGRLRNARMDSEIAKAKRMIEQKREAGRKGGKARNDGKREAGAKHVLKQPLSTRSSSRLAGGEEGGTHPRGYRSNGVAEARAVPLTVPNNDAEIDAAIAGIEATARRSTAARRARLSGPSGKSRGVA